MTRSRLQLVVLRSENVELLPESFILQLGLLHSEQVVLIEVLHPGDIILLGSNIKLKLSEMFVTSLLKGAELKDELLVALRLVTKVSFELDDATLLLVFTFS